MFYIIIVIINFKTKDNMRQQVTRKYPVPVDIEIGQLACADCIYDATCESLHENCAANCLFDNAVYHYKNCVAKKIEDTKTQRINVTMIHEVIGKKIVDVHGGKPGDEHLTLTFEDGTSILFYHEQDCCERVSIDDVNGSIEDMIGQVLLKCSYTFNVNEGPRSDWDDSYTWTFYHFATRKGYVDVKWYGTSNGYYSETVSYKIFDETGEVISECY